MLIGYKRGQGSIVLRIKILNSSVSTGAGLTGLSSTSSGLIISTIADNEATATAYTVAASNVETVTTLGTFAAPSSGKCRFREVDATNHKGVYEIQLADARYAVSNAKSLLVSVLGATNAAETDVVIPLRDLDPFSSVRSELAVELARIDTTIGSRLASAGYTAPLNAADTRTAIGLASANLDTQIAALPLASDWTSTRAGYLDSVLLAFNSNRTVQVTGSHHVAAVLHDSEPGSIHATTFDAGAIDAAALATSAANEIADALLDRADAIETGLTLRGAIRLDTAALAGKVSGAAGTSVAIRNVGDTKTRISATVDADGNRTAVTTDAT
jgi:hypothetical protein